MNHDGLQWHEICFRAAMQIRSSLRFALVALTLCPTSIACLPNGEFDGELGVLRFTSNLGAPWLGFEPATPVAEGSKIVIDAFNTYPAGIDDDDVVDPNRPGTTPSLLDPAAAVTGVVLDIDHVEATAAAEGTFTFAFARGEEVIDQVSLDVRSIGTARFVDPVRQWVQSTLGDDRVATVADVESLLVLPPGGRIALGAGFFGTDGALLATDDASVGFASTGETAITFQGHAVTVAAPQRIDGRGVVAVRHDDVERATLEVVTADPARVASLELQLLDAFGPVVHATARLGDGRILWQPPIAWTVEEPLGVVDQADLGVSLIGETFDPVRTDILILRLPVEDGPVARTRDVTARIGDVSATITVTIPPRRAPPPSPPPPPPPPLFACDASTASPLDSVAAAGIMGVLVLAPRRRRSRTQRS